MAIKTMQKKNNNTPPRFAKASFYGVQVIFTKLNKETTSG